MRLPTTLSLLALSTLAVGIPSCNDDSDRPGGHLNAKTTALVQYDSCSALESDLKQMLTYEAWADIEGYYSGNGGFGVGEDDSAGGAEPSNDSGGGRQEGTDFSGTNNQVDGVDEADLVKTDGYHVYALNGHRLHIFGVPQFGQLVPESTTEIEGLPQEMLVDKDANRAVVFSYIPVWSLPAGHPLRTLTGHENDTGDGWWWRSQDLTKITVLDITDRTHPTLVREVFQEGWYTTARKVDSTVRLATYGYINNPWMSKWWSYVDGHDETYVKAHAQADIYALTLPDLIPQMWTRTPDGQFTSNSLSQSSCQSFYRPTDSHARGVSSIISFDLLGEDFSFEADSVISNWATFYESKDHIVLAESAHDWWWYWYYQTDEDQLNVHVFDTSVPGKAAYVGSGRIDGQVHDQFAIDENNGTFRIATTTGNFWRWWDDSNTAPTPENHVWTLQQNGNSLETVGHLDGIAPGETIRSTRFIGDKGYVVTAKYTDPLYTIDLADPTNPHIVGELHVPGFSSYLHPLGDGKLLSIGIGGTSEQLDWSQTSLQTFDVANPAAPSQTAQLSLTPPANGSDWNWSWSEAQWEHKAFQYFAPKKLLAIPQATYSENYNQNTGEYTWRYLSKVNIIDVDDATGALHLRGTIDHSPYYTTDQWWSFQDIRRTIFMGDFIYAVSDKAITVNRADDLSAVTVQTLPGYVPEDYYWWW
ncbi:hypothetical protein BH11MYX2_BH11MYX2_08370 [soil metagenome]